jgi:pyruvate,orthophosphate dikinase
MGASPGTASGQIAFSTVDAIQLVGAGNSVILVRIETTPEDVPAMKVVAGIITTHGGITGDAAIVARSLGKPCIAVCSDLVVDYPASSLTVRKDSVDDDEVVLKTGDTITINGGTGEIWAE